MSLVAAYTDSESESEGEGENETLKKSIETEFAENIEIEDEDDWEKSKTNSQNEESGKIFSSLPEPSTSTFKLNEQEEEVEDEFLKKKPSKEDVLFKKEQALLEKEMKESKQDDTGSKHFLSKFTTGGSKNTKKRVMISIPTLAEVCSCFICFLLSS